MDIDGTVLEQAKIALASFCGGTVRLFLRPAQTLPKSIFLVFCCVVCGYYFTPVAMELGRFNPSWTGAVGAFIGLVGLSIAEAMLAVKWHDFILSHFTRRPR